MLETVLKGTFYEHHDHDQLYHLPTVTAYLKCSGFNVLTEQTLFLLPHPVTVTVSVCCFSIYSLRLLLYEFFDEVLGQLTETLESLIVEVPGTAAHILQCLVVILTRKRRQTTQPAYKQYQCTTT